MPPGRQHARRDDVLRASGVASSSSAPRVKAGMAAARRRLVARMQRRAVLLDVQRPEPVGLGFQRSSGQHGRSMAALYWQIASQPSSGVMRPSWTRRM